MTLSVVKTPSDAAVEALLASALGELPGGSDVAQRRIAARDQFEKTGLPNKRVEEWKYSDWKRAMPAELALAGSVSDAAVSERLAASVVLSDIERYRLVLVNGQVNRGLSDVAALEGKVSVKFVSDALGDGSFVLDDPEVAQKDIALSLNTALLQDGVVIAIADGVALDKPLEICNVMLDGGLSVTRNRVVLGKGAKATVIESFTGDDNAYQLNAATDYRIADGAEGRVVRLLADGAQAVHVSSTTVLIGAEANFEHFTMTTGGAFTRSQSFVRFDGEHSDANFYGTMVIDGRQHADITLAVDHAVPNCNSKEQYRTVLDDRAEGVFQGKIMVRQIAQKTDGQMMSQALLLSEDAAFFNKPELEIFADDVQCAHGATCGELDEDLLFYLRARGIPMSMAKKMLVMAFLAEAVENVSDERIVEGLEAYIADRLGLEH